MASGRKEMVIRTSYDHLHLYYKTLLEVVLCSDYVNFCQIHCTW